MNKNAFQSLWLAMLLMIILLGCTGGNATSSSMPTQTALPTSTRTVETVTPMPTVLPCKSLTVPPISTFVPTLPITEAEDRLIELLGNNGGCQLPCLFGITPGQVKVHEIGSRLCAFRNIIPGEFIFDEFDGSIGFKFLRDNIAIKAHLMVEGDRQAHSDTVKRVELVLSVYQAFGLNSYIYDSPYYAQYFQYYTLPYLLSNYGSPPDIYSAAYDGGISGERGNVYLLRLNYKASGWIAIFIMPLYQRGEFWEACPTKAISVLLAGDIESADEQGFLDQFSGVEYLPIEESIALTVDEFYDQYKDPANEQCLEIPVELFPKIDGFTNQTPQPSRH